MNNNSFFGHLSSKRIAEIIARSKGPICYAAPGIHLGPAQALAGKAKNIGTNLITIWIDFDERVLRMGYGDIEAVKVLREADIDIQHAAGLRSALFIADGEGYSFSPVPLYLEAEPSEDVRNAMRLSKEQVNEALVRLSPIAKVVAIATAAEIKEKERISYLPEEGKSLPITTDHYEKVNAILTEAPPVKFDIARQVRVFESYLQYIEISLNGAAIQRHRFAIPPKIQKLGESKELEGRLRTTFDLIEKGGKLSSKPLDDELNDIRTDLTRSLGKSHGRVVLKGIKPHLEKRLTEFRKKLEQHQKTVERDLQNHLEESKNQVIDYYIPRVIESPPDALIGQLLNGKAGENDARQWLKCELDKAFPKADELIKKMDLDVRYKDVTFETLNRDDFLVSVKNAYPNIDWDKTYNEFKAAGEENKFEAKSS